MYKTHLKKYYFVKTVVLCLQQLLLIARQILHTSVGNLFEVFKIKVLSTTTVDCPLSSTSSQIVHCHILPHLPKSLPLCCFSYFSYSVQTEVTFRTQMDGDKAGLSKS